MITPPRCPCGSGTTFGTCCEPILDGTPAPTAEALMRSRFTAYSLERGEYLLYSWHPSKRPSRITFAENQRWTRLDILRVVSGNLLDSSGTVEFTAHYVNSDGAASQSENSNFTRHDGRWVYVDGIHSS